MFSYLSSEIAFSFSALKACLFYWAKIHNYQLSGYTAKIELGIGFCINQKIALKVIAIGCFLLIIPNLLHAQEIVNDAIVKPEKIYRGDNSQPGGIVAKTVPELIEKMNVYYTAVFNACIGTPDLIYNCNRQIAKGVVGHDDFGWTNGEHRFYSLSRDVQSQRRDAAGVVTSFYQPSGGVAVIVTWSCPKGYLSQLTTIGSNSNRMICVIQEEVAKNKGPFEGKCPTPSPYEGNPINFSIGNKYQEEIDYEGMRGVGISLKRHYNSLDGRWRHDFSMRLEFDNARNKIFLTHGTGRLSVFSTSNGTITPENIEFGKLSNAGELWLYTTSKNELFTFNNEGLLIHQKHPAGIERNITYNQDQVVVSDNFGNILTLTQDEAGQPLSFQSGSTQGTYIYNQDKRLEQVALTVGGVTRTRLYHYEDSRDTKLLTGITDERGVRFATWQYDDKGRAVSSEHAGGAERIQISYDNPIAISVTNEFGKIAKYKFREINGLKRIASIEGEPSANCPNSNSFYSYNNRGQLISKTDNKGYRTTYVYDTRGLESSRTEAAGTPQARTITTEWHPTMFLPLVVTEPKRIIRYQYDNQGRQLSRTVEAR
jgi:YD repeat-containing protein